MMKLKNILITGASGTIGQAIARKLAGTGYSLYLHFNTGQKRAADLACSLEEKYPDQAFGCVQADLSLPEGPERLLSQIKLPVSGVVYNCGKSEVGLFQDVSEPVVRELIQLQLTSPFRLIQSLIQPMIRQKQGRIIIVSSIWGLTGASTEVLYSMVKGGQNTFVKALAKEVAPSHITVNAVAPGAVDTPMMKLFSESDREEVKSEIPAGRFARPEEIAALILFLLGPDTDYLNGQIISENGAWYC
jgi:Dehydrogenases with different specificities (related to short-chain alcohol dehydrogenases)